MKFIQLIFFIAFLSTAAFAQQNNVVSAKSEPLSIDFVPSKPTVTWIRPTTRNQVFDQANAAIEFGVNSESPIKEVKLMVNNRKVGDSRGFKVVKNYSEFDEKFTRQIALDEGSNNIEVTLVNEEGGEASISTSMIFKKPTVIAMSDDRTDRALIFATNDYNSEAWGDLHNPITDAKDIATELNEIYGFETTIIENPTKNDVILKIRELYGEAQTWGEDDQLLIFFAGHGYFDELTRKGYLVFKDGADPSEDLTYNTYWDYEVLNGYVDRIPAEHILLMLDACFGGTFDRLIADAGHRGAGGVYRNISAAELIKRRLRYKSRYYITSGGKEYVADGDPGDNSPFTKQLLGILRTGGNLPGGILTIESIKEQLSLVQGISSPRSGSFGDNEPGSTFLFVPKF